MTQNAGDPPPTEPAHAGPNAPPVVAAAPPAAAPRLILASASPRRKLLLEQTGYDFEIIPADIDEESLVGKLAPIALAERLASAKAYRVSRQYPDAVVLAADTLVSFGETVLNKPENADHARAMLSLLSGTTHLVISGVSVMRQDAGFSQITHVISAVRMSDLSRNQIEKYIATNEWQGKAGGYGIQDRDPFVQRISGCHTNIVGLPMKHARRLLEAAGIFPGRPRPAAVS